MNIKKALASIAITAGMLVGGAVAAAPAHADQVGTLDYGTYVWFSSCGGAGTCTGWHLRIWTMNGAHNYLFFGDTARNVRDVCPPDSDHRLQYYRPNGTGPVIKAYGACQDMEWAATGTYQFGLTD